MYAKPLYLHAVGTPVRNVFRGTHTQRERERITKLFIVLRDDDADEVFAVRGVVAKDVATGSHGYAPD